jgi:hypothetical protein
MKNLAPLLLVAACSSGGITPNGDMASTTVAAFCAGTAVAGTCIQTFFAPLASCFPEGGACTSEDTGSGKNLCWADGSKLIGTLGAGGVPHGVFSRNGATCYSVDVGLTGSSADFEVANGTTSISYSTSTGNARCPDGTSVKLGTDFGGCAALKALLDPSGASCTAGACH